MSVKRALVMVAAMAGAVEAAPVGGPRSVGAFYTPDDGAMHAIVGKTNGDVVEAFWWEGTGVGVALIAQFPEIVAVAGYYTPWDSWRHALVALKNGLVWDVRYHPCCGAYTSLAVNLNGWGEMKSMTAWVDPQQHTNIAFLTKWGYGNILGVHQRGGNTPASTTLINIYSNDSAIDVAGHHEIWNSTSMVTVAVGSPTHLEQIYWNDNQTPASYFAVQSGSNVPWATRFGNGTLVSLSATDQFCYFCTQWGGVEQMELLTTTNHLMTYNVNNGGGALHDDWPFTYGPQVRSVSGPFLSPISGNHRRNTLVMMSNGDLWDMHPVLTSGTPSWTYRYIGAF